MDGTASQRPTIWLVGDCEHPDLAGATDWLRTNFNCRLPTAIEDPDASPAAIVLAQSRPGSISAREVEALHRRAPLARLILLTGPWCDGEFRSSRNSPGVARIRWHEWRLRLPAEPATPVLRLPRTATDAERLEGTLRELSGQIRAHGRVAIITPLCGRYSVLADACNALGWHSTWFDGNRPQRTDETDVLLVDGWANLQVDAQPSDSRPRVLLLPFARPGEIESARDRGIREVIAEPFSLASLAAALTAAAPHVACQRNQQSVA
jgi:hypothetical protein